MLYRFLDHIRFTPPNDDGGDSDADGQPATQKQAEQTGMKFEDGSPQNGDMEIPKSEDNDGAISRQLENVTKKTDQKLDADQKTNGQQDGEEDGDESQQKPEADESTEEEGEEEGEETTGEESEGEDASGESAEAQGEDEEDEEGNQEAPFYDPERDVEGEAPHSNRFDSRETAEEAAVNKAQMVQATLQELEEDGIGPGAIPIPPQLEGDLDKLEDIANDVGTVIQWDDENLKEFLTESDRFRQRLENRAERKRSERETSEATQEFEQVQNQLVEDFQELGIDLEENEEAIKAIDQGKDKAVDYLQNQVEQVAEDAVSDEQQELNEWLNSDEAEQMTPAEVVEERDKWQQRINRKKQQVKEEWEPVIERMERAYELASKAKTGQDGTQSQQEILETAYQSFQEWQADRKGDLDVLNDDPAAKRELKSMKNWALNNLDQFNNLQNPRDWNKVPEKYREYKRQLRAKHQKKKVSGDSSSSQDQDDQQSGGDQPRTPGDQSALRSSDEREGDDHKKNEDLMNDLVNKTAAKT